MAAKAKKAVAEDIDLEEGDAPATPAAPAGLISKIPLIGKIPPKILIITAVLVVVLSGGGVAGYLIFGDRHEPKPAAVVVPPAFFDVPEVLVNLSTVRNERTQYLKVKVVLELPDNALRPQIQAILPRVMDAFQIYLRELRPVDLDGSAGLFRLKEELTRRINAAIAPNRINAVLFKEIVVQ
jgi:flagellar FliL protein